jgi:hypothetical protein
MPIETCPICDSKVDKGACPKCGIWLDHRSNASTADALRRELDNVMKVVGFANLEQRRCWKCGLWRFPQEACCGPEPPDIDRGFTIDDVLSGKVPWPAGIPRKRKAAK